MTRIQIFPTLESLSHAAADLFSQIINKAVEARGRSMVALSGGSTPLALYRLLAKSPYSIDLPWRDVHFFWGDERCVAPEDTENSYHQAYEAWLNLVDIPERNIHRALGELGPEAAAKDYEFQLKGFAEAGFDWPRFDLVLLGLGSDGHTASLFPGSREDEDKAVIAVTANYQDRPANRVSLTPKVFNAARNIVFLAVGAEKAQALATTVSGPRDAVKYPAQRIKPTDGNLIWMIDQDASEFLPKQIEGFTIEGK